MEKSVTLNLIVNPRLKIDLESVFGIWGISTAVDMFLNYGVLTGVIPFVINLPSAHGSIDMTKMSSAESCCKIQKGYECYKASRTQNAVKIF